MIVEERPAGEGHVGQGGRRGEVLAEVVGRNDGPGGGKDAVGQGQLRVNRFAIEGREEVVAVAREEGMAGCPAQRSWSL